MIHEKGDITNSLGTAIIIVFFLLIFSSLSDKSITSTESSSRYELKAGFHDAQVKANIAEAVSLPSIKISTVLLLHNTFNDAYKVIANDKTITQGFIELQKMKLTIKHVFLCRFYYHRLSQDADDLPVLS